MQTANELAAARKEQQARGNDSGTANRYPSEGKQAAAAADKNDAPSWDEV